MRLIATILAITAAPAVAGTQTISLFSPSNNRNTNFVVYTPPDYATSTHRYPVVIDLHGMGGNPTNRANVQVVPHLDAAIRAGTALPMIYVFPDGQTDSFYGDAFDGHKRVYSNAIGEVLPYVDANFRTLNHRRFRAIDGFSMGGFGAMMFAAKRTDLFSAVVGYGGAYLSWPGLLPTVKSEMYNNTQANFTPFSVYDQTQLNAAVIARDLKIRMLVGGDDPIRFGNQTFNTFLNNTLSPHGMANVPLTVVPGIGHDGKLMYETGIGLEFLDEHFGSVIPGDADVDDDVDFSDLVTLARHYNTTAGGSWLTGDFTWDGRVNFSDLVALAQHYSGTGAAAATFTDDWALAQSLVPEPTGLLPMLAVATSRRRRRA